MVDEPLHEKKKNKRCRTDRIADWPSGGPCADPMEADGAAAFRTTDRKECCVR